MNIVVIAAVLPAFVLLYYIWRRDKYQQEPVKQLLKGFGFGVLATVVAAPLEILLQQLGLAFANPQTWFAAAWNAFFGVALVEEGVKLFFLWLLLRKNPYFDEHMDGVVYAVAVGMGFAAAENISYLFTYIDQWRTLALSRAVFSVPGHFMFAVAMGYYYSVHHFDSSSSKLMILLMPILLHGIFDSLLMMSDVTPEWGGVLWFAFVVFCLTLPGMANRKIDSLLSRDKKDRDNPLIKF